ncbi:recombinase family protein [Microvirga arabica]|uniref:recombinase family protein n=1 Tax=Microvirga arabica TaxID=1128671 RepID=UPI0019396B3C|nr:recombinase family protein [Microvirga arabica]MBM1172848.1 recombinase family protein [Microvirga arabica]
MNRALGYTRVSTQAQGQSGFGLDAQETQIREFAKELGYRIQKVFSDVHTGRGESSVRDRRGLQDALELARKKRWPIFIADIDRLGRHEPLIQKLLDDPELTIISANDGEGADKAILRGQAKRAQRDGDMISERTRKKLKTLKDQGQRLGNLKSLKEAQRKGGEATKRKSTLRTLEYEPLIRQIRDTGAKTAREFADALNQRNRLTPQGKPWNEENIRRLLRSTSKLGKAREQEEAKHQKYADNPQFGAF